MLHNIPSLGSIVYYSLTRGHTACFLFFYWKQCCKEQGTFQDSIIYMTLKIEGLLNKRMVFCTDMRAQMCSRSCVWLRKHHQASPSQCSQKPPSLLQRFVYLPVISSKQVESLLASSWNRIPSVQIQWLFLEGSVWGWEVAENGETGSLGPRSHLPTWPSHGSSVSLAV